jgi:hypothetical protein
MQLTKNKAGKDYWVGVDVDSLITEEKFHKVNIGPSLLDGIADSDDVQFAFHCDLGSITVLYRLTGYGFGIRDTETGFRDVDGKFWLASGMFDVRDHMPMKFSDAVKMIKKNANNCTGQ